MYNMTHLLIVEASPLCFGCVKAHDLAGRSASVILYENTRVKHVDIVPNAGDLLLCRLVHSSVYIPVYRIARESLSLRCLPIPSDVLQAYFPLFERLKYSTTPVR